MPNAPVLCIGARWKASDVYWRSAPENAELLGKHSAKAVAANFAFQSGIYVLYSSFTPIYVGQANKSLFARLKSHWVSGDLVGRWDRFTWFGFRKVVRPNDPTLSVPDVTFHISTKQLLDHLEAIMIHGFEPSMNGQDGRFGKSVKRYSQVRDSRLGPTDREMLELMLKASDSVMDGWKITKTGWKRK